MKKSSWWCHKLFLIPIIVATFLGIITAADMDYKSKNLPDVVEQSYISNVNFMLEGFKYSDVSLKDYLFQTTETLDNNSGVAAGLYTTEGKEIYPLNKVPDADGSPLFSESLRISVIESIPKENTIIEFPIKVLQRSLVYKFHYVIEGDYVVIYAIRPDYISKYGLDFNSFYWWVLGGMLFNILTYIVTFTIFRRYQIFYDKRVDNYNKRRKFVKANREN
jgi:hypothetical protein